MAKFNIPNLCGASPELNALTSKVDDIKKDILAKLDLPASDIASSVSGKLTELKAAFDNLSLDLPDVPNVNFQSELTGLINDIPKDTIAGLAAFSNKLAELELDFGPTLKEKGLSLPNLVTEATTKLAAGGDVCALAPNIEISAANSGTGVTTEEKEQVVSTGLTVVAIAEDYKTLVSVEGKSVGSNFFSGISGYKVNGRTLTLPKSYEQVKIKYIISLIKEKAVEVKQATLPPEKETVSIVTSNTDAKDTSFAGLIAKFKKDVESAPSKNDVSKDLAGIKSAISFIGSPEFKAKQEKDFATWQTEYKKLKADPLNYKPVVTPKGETIKVTTPEATITKEIKTDISGATYTETKRVTSSDAGFTTRPKEKDVQLVRLDLAKEVLSEIDISTYQDTYELIQEVIDYFEPTTSLSSIEIPDPVWNLIEVSLMAKGNFNPVTRETSPDGIVAYEITDFNNRGSELSTIYYQLNGQTITFNDIAGRPVDPFTERDVFATNITYITLDKIDPNYKG